MLGLLTKSAKIGYQLGKRKDYKCMGAKEPRAMSRAVMRPGRCEHAGAEPDLTYHGDLPLIRRG